MPSSKNWVKSPYTLHYRVSGRPAQPGVLFLHGFMGAADDWAGMTAYLDDHFYCLAVDLPGHGASTGLADEAYTMPGAAQAVVDLLDTHGVEHGAVVGYSMGGRLALYLALHYPERCRALVLESASPGLKSEQEREERRATDEDRAVRLETEDFATFLQDWYRQPLFASLALRERFIDQMIEQRSTNDPRELARSLRGMGTGRQPSLWERLPALRVSTCAVVGVLDPKYVTIAAQMEKQSAYLRRVIVPEAGHIVHAEQPRRFVRLLRSFLKQP